MSLSFCHLSHYSMQTLLVFDNCLVKNSQRGRQWEGITCISSVKKNPPPFRKQITGLLPCCWRNAFSSNFRTILSGWLLTDVYTDCAFFRFTWPSPQALFAACLWKLKTNRSSVLRRDTPFCAPENTKMGLHSQVNLCLWKMRTSAI